MSTVYDPVETNEEQKRRISIARDAFKALHRELEKAIPNKARYWALVKTKLEEAAMFATKAISFEGKDLG